MLNQEFSRFVDDWIERSGCYNDNDQNDCFDKFFTQFVVFNRLYSEATFELNRRGVIQLSPNRPLPDKKGATEYTLEMIGLGKFDDIYQNHLSGAVDNISTLIEDERFYIRLSMPEGNRQPEKDLELLCGLRSTGKTRALAVLEVLYKIRCNLFHGHKAFDSVQLELLRPVNLILKHIVDELYDCLRRA